MPYKSKSSRISALVPVISQHEVHAFGYEDRPPISSRRRILVDLHLGQKIGIMPTARRSWIPRWVYLMTRVGFRQLLVIHVERPRLHRQGVARQPDDSLDEVYLFVGMKREDDHLAPRRRVVSRKETSNQGKSFPECHLVCKNVISRAKGRRHRVAMHTVVVQRHLPCQRQYAQQGYDDEAPSPRSWRDDAAKSG